MIISEREKIILNILIKNIDTPLSIKDISKLSKIKERTLYREIKNLEYFLENQNIKLIKEKSKYYLVGDTSTIDNSLLDTTIEQGYSQDNKINLILCDLIFSAETSIKEISEKFYLSYNTVATTIGTAEKILADYKITLTRKKGTGIYLEGSEVDKRVLLISILSNEIKDDEFFAVINNVDTYSTNPFIKFLDVDFLRKIFTNNRNINMFKLYTDTSIKKILISLNIVFVRYGKTEQNFSPNYTENEYSYVEELLEKTHELTTVNLEDDNFSKLFLVKILRTCKLIEQVTYFNDKYSYTLIYKVNNLIKSVSEKSNIDFTMDKNLANGLIIHIESAIKRYQLKLVEENNDLQDFVLKNYNELYLTIKSELLATFDEINFSATELSYIVLHFASSYEQIYRENFVRALVICSSGIGSSKILGSQIRKNISEIKNIEYSVPAKLEDDLKKNYDIIISTIQLDNNVDYILVPTILRDTDIENIRNKLANIRSFKKFSVDYTQDDKNSANYETISTIINNTTFYTDNSEDIETIIKNSLDTPLPFEIKNKNIVTKNLVTRHEKSSVVIPNTNLALFHTLDNDIDEPFIIICSLQNKLTMKNVLDDNEQVKIFFIMVSPNEQKYTDLLGQISIAILDDEVLKSALNSNNNEFIKTKLELIMTKHLIKE